MIFLFFSIRVFFTHTDDSQDSRGREGTIFYSTLPLPPAHEHWDIYLQLCMWDDYQLFLIATLVFTRLLLNEIYHLVELPFEQLIDNSMFLCLLDGLILDFVIAIWHWKPVDLNSHWLSSLYHKLTDWPSVLVTPSVLSICHQKELKCWHYLQKYTQSFFVIVNSEAATQRCS